MTSFYVEVTVFLYRDDRDVPLPADRLEAYSDALMEQLVDLPEDVDLSLDVRAGAVVFCVTLDAEGPRKAVDRADDIATRSLAAVGLTEAKAVEASARRSELVPA